MKRYIKIVLAALMLACVMTACSRTGHVEVSESEGSHGQTEQTLGGSGDDEPEVPSGETDDQSTPENTTTTNGKETSSVSEKDTTTQEGDVDHEGDIPTLAEGETTAYVEEGETNEQGVIDGQPLTEGAAESNVAATAVSDGSDIVSDMPYLIKVNRQANCVTIYVKDETGHYTVPVKSMICSCARSGYETPLGTFQITDHYVWRELYGNVYGYYSTRIVGSILFHSVPYYQPNPSMLEQEEYDKLGENASMGCIRLRVQDSKWIYENCAAGTYVIIYDSPDPGPLGRPTAAKISGVRADLWGWDPTDVTEGNPWLSCTTKLTLSKTTVNLKYSAKVTLEDYATAVDWAGNPATVSVSGTVDTKKAGTYEVTYTVTDFNGRSDSQVIKFIVAKKESEKETTAKEKETTAKEKETNKAQETTTAVSATEATTTAAPTTAAPTTAAPTTAAPTTAAPTTAAPTTAAPTTTATPTTTTAAPTTTATPTTTTAPTTVAPTTTAEPTTEESTASPEQQESAETEPTAAVDEQNLTIE